MSDVWKRELAELRARIKDLDNKSEELLAAGPIAPGVIEAAAELAHQAAELELRLTDTEAHGQTETDRGHGSHPVEGAGETDRVDSE